MALIWLWMLGCLGALLALRRWLAPALLSPVVLVAGSMLVLAMGGVLLYQRVAMAPGGAGIQLLISDELTTRTARLLLLATTAFLVGSAVGVVRRNARPFSFRFRPMSVPSSRMRSLALLCLVPLLYNAVSPGLPYLLRRSTYLGEGFTGPVAVVMEQLSIAAVVVLGNLAALRTGRARAFAVVITVAYGLVFFAGGSRRLALTPVLFALGWFAAAPSRRSRVGLLGAGLVSLYLIRLPLFLRDQADHGLLPYVRELPGYLVDRSGWDNVALNVLVSFAIIGVTALVEPRFPVTDLGVSLNPLPGGMAGWYDIAPFHRLNPFTPYGAVGELGNVGSLAVVGYFVVLGLAMAYLDRRVRAHLSEGRQAAALLVVGLVGLFCLFNQQYNLRQSTRLVYYAIALELALVLWTWFRQRDHRTAGTGDAPQQEPALRRWNGAETADRAIVPSGRGPARPRASFEGQRMTDRTTPPE